MTDSRLTHNIQSDPIPPEIRTRSPLIDSIGLRMLRHLQEHPNAPKWNHEAGDRLLQADLDALAELRERLATARTGFVASPPTAILEWVSERRDLVPLFRDSIPTGTALAPIWGDLRTMSREDVAVRLDRLVPDDADLERLIVYRTAGTTGHALIVPHDARAAASYQPLIEQALAKYGLRPSFGPDKVACFLIGAQRRTVTFPSVLSAWRGGGFAKLNLARSEWRKTDDPHRFFEGLRPMLLTGDPISYAEMIRLAIPARPLALISTSVAMNAQLKRRLAEYCGCPVIDWYSLTETGPIGYACTHGHGYHVLPHDLYVEAVDASGRPVPPGTRGEITVTGGRNPFLPLLRYRTGDWGVLSFDPCPCGDPMPRILELEGRAPILYRSASGEIVNTVDVSRLLREFPLVQHEFVQRADRSCDLTVRPLASPSAFDPEGIRRALVELFGKLPIRISVDPELGNRHDSGKVFAYRSELLLED